MTAREKVLRAYGGCCRYCGAAGPLHLDHIAAGGTAHRKALGCPLPYWLCREKKRTGAWSPLVQLLCTACHQRKTARERTAMPARKGATALNIALPDHLAAQLSVLAKEPDFHGSKSLVLETALRAFVDGRSTLTSLDSVHDHLARLGLDVMETVRTLDTHVAPLEKVVHALHPAPERPGAAPDHPGAAARAEARRPGAGLRYPAPGRPAPPKRRLFGS